MASVPPQGNVNPVQPCKGSCDYLRSVDVQLTRGARDLSSAYQSRAISRPGTTGSECAALAPQMNEVAARFERYGNALPSARAANNLNQLKDKDTGGVTEYCLERLSLNAAQLNRELGIAQDSPNAITENDLRNDHTGYRSAIYRSKETGKLIVVSRDTQPDSLMDWKTNIDNGAGLETDQYAAARGLATKLSASGQNFDIGGYSKGGGLAQEMGLISPKSNIYVFNSAGLHENSLKRTGAANLESLSNRTSSFSAEGDFLTFMNNTTDPQREVRNAQFLYKHLAGDASGVNPMKIEYENPSHKKLADQWSWFDSDLKAQKASAQEKFVKSKKELLDSVQKMIDRAASSSGHDRLFPPVRAATHETIPNSMSPLSKMFDARGDEASLGKLAQHQMSNVLGPMENQLALDRQTLRNFMSQCGS